MSKQFLAMMGVLAVTFSAGVGFGLYLASDPSRSDGATKASSTGSASSFYSDSAAQDREQGNTLLSNRIRELEKELTNHDKDSRVILDDRLAFYKKHLNNLNITPYDDNLKVTSVMADFLKLTPEEQKALEMHLTQIQNEMKRLEQGRATVIKESDKSVTYELPAIPEGAAIQQELSTFVETDIGKERAFAFLGEGQWEPDQLFYGFGKGPIDIEIITQTKSNGLPYLLKETFPNGASEERPVDSLPAKYQNLIQLDARQ